MYNHRRSWTQTSILYFELPVRMHGIYGFLAKMCTRYKLTPTTNTHFKCPIQSCKADGWWLMVDFFVSPPLIPFARLFFGGIFPQHRGTHHSVLWRFLQFDKWKLHYFFPFSVSLFFSFGVCFSELFLPVRRNFHFSILRLKLAAAIIATIFPQIFYELLIVIFWRVKMRFSHSKK